MSFDAQSPDLVLAVVGTGAMGRGIAQIAAQAGVRVVLFDVAPGAAAKARDALHTTFEMLRTKGKLDAASAERARQAVTVAQAIGELAHADLVVEAIVENLEAKQSLFRELEALLRPDAVLATNTSSLSVTAIAAACTHPQRVAGYHFFNPVPLMKVVEVVAGLRSAPAVLKSLGALAERMGHLPVNAQDTPGFIVNHAGRGYGTEALKMLGEGIGSPADIDAVLRDLAQFRLGPFELFDLTGLDVSVPVMESVYRQYFEEPRYRPSPLAAQRRTAGLLGRKTNEGYYRYAEGKQQLPAVVAPPAARPARVWVSREHAAFGAAAADLVRRLGATLDESERPDAASLCVVTPLGEDVTHCLARQGLDGRRVVGLDLLLGTQQRRAVFLNPLTDAQTRDEAHGLFAADGVPVTVLRDSVGLGPQRVLATIVNIACDMAQQGIATPVDIDRAVTLGLGYPQGPLAWGDQLGASTVLAILDNMLALTGDPRYRPSPWLRRRAQLGASLLQPEPSLGVLHA